MIVTRGGGLGVERESGGRNDESQVDNDERSKSARKSLIVEDSKGKKLSEAGETHRQK